MTCGRVRAGLLVAGALALIAAPGWTAAALAATTVTHRPQRLAVVQDPRLDESSGLAVSPTHRDLVWTIDDSGSQPVVYAVSPSTGRTRAVLRLAGVDARDTEALAAGRSRGRSWLWVADTGDNRQVRTSVVLRLVREPDQVRSQSVPVTSLRVRYPRGPADVETLVWLPDGRLLLVTKAFLSARVYEVPPEAVRRALAGHDVTDPVLARQVGTVPQTLATDGSALPDGRLVVRGYESATVYGWDGDRLVAQERVPLPAQPQGEGIAVEPGGRTALVSSEGVRQPLYRVALPDAPRPTPSATPTPSPDAAGQHRDTPSAVGAPSDNAGMQRGTPATTLAAVVAGGAVVLVAAGLGLRSARRRSRRRR